MPSILGVLSQEAILTSTISATAIITGSIVGGICSWLISKKSLYRNERIQHQIAEESREFEKRHKMKRVYENACIIRLDICTAMFQTIRSLKNSSRPEINYISYFIPVPFNNSYSSAVASLENYFDLKELSYIYQLYSIIEKLNYDIKNMKYNNNDDIELMKFDNEMFLRKLYADNYKRVLNLDIEKISYPELYDNDLIKSGYRNVLTRLDEICCQGSKENNI